MTIYNYYSEMQELSFRATMALAALGNEGLKDFYSAAEEGFYNKLQKIAVDEAQKNINQSQIEQYLITKDFVETKENEAAYKLREEMEVNKSLNEGEQTIVEPCINQDKSE